MNKMIAVSLLVLSVSAGAAQGMGSPSSSWKGTLAKEGARSVVELHFSASASGWKGFFWGRSLTPIPLENIRLGHSVHFEIPQMGIFDGILNGETMQGSFQDARGEGWFKLEKQIEWDDPRNASLP